MSLLLEPHRAGEAGAIHWRLRSVQPLCGTPVSSNPCGVRWGRGIIRPDRIPIIPDDRGVPPHEPSSKRAPRPSARQGSSVCGLGSKRGSVFAPRRKQPVLLNGGSLGESTMLCAFPRRPGRQDMLNRAVAAATLFAGIALVAWSCLSGDSHLLALLIGVGCVIVACLTYFIGVLGEMRAVNRRLLKEVRSSLEQVREHIRIGSAPSHELPGRMGRTRGGAGDSRRPN